MVSAFTNSRTARVSRSSDPALVVLPAPLGPASTTRRGGVTTLARLGRPRQRRDETRDVLRRRRAQRDAHRAARLLLERHHEHALLAQLRGALLGVAREDRDEEAALVARVRESRARGLAVEGADALVEQADQARALRVGPRAQRG